MAIKDYSTTPGSNTAISGVNIAENCNASGINDAIRQLMADIATAFNGAYAPAAAINEAAVTVASASTTLIGAAAGNVVDISGTTTINAFDTLAAGARRQCRITGAGLTLVHSGALLCPGSTNLVLGTGDQFTVVSYGGGLWIIVGVQRSGGDPTMGWATKATQQTGTDAVRSVTAAQQHQHPSAGKAYGLVATGASTVVGSYPSSASCVQNAVGNYTVTFGVTMASTNYVVGLTVDGSANLNAVVATRTATQLQILIYDASGNLVDAGVHYDIKGTLA